jgi:hypothetical protein
VRHRYAAPVECGDHPVLAGHVVGGRSQPTQRRAPQDPPVLAVRQ